MQTSPTRLKKPWLVWMARITTAGFIFAYIWIHFVTIQEFIQEASVGAVLDIRYEADDNNNLILTYLSQEAINNGLHPGDRLLNPEANTFGKIGTELTFQIQRGDQPIREFTFKRQPWNEDVYGATNLLGLPPNTTITLVLFITLFITAFSIVAALLLGLLRSDDWMALLSATVLIGLYDIYPKDRTQWMLIVIASGDILLWLWLILFPNGLLAPKWSWILLLCKIPYTVQANLSWDAPDTITQIIKILNWVTVPAIVALVVYRYRYVFSPTERQQIKWVIFPYIVAILPILISDQIYKYYLDAEQYGKAFAAYYMNTLFISLLISTVAVGTLFSIFKYRLYDVDLIVSRTIVYSSLTGILGLVFTVSVNVSDYILKRMFGDRSDILTVLVSALPITALFGPVRERLQEFVDSRFKPEDVDFENTFIEFTSDLSSFFTVKELAALLSNQALEQLALSYASVFLRGQNGGLKHINTACADDNLEELVLDSGTVEIIKRGELAEIEGDSMHSLVVPLTVPRARKPSLIGALVLGPRLTKLGYSTDMKRSLQKFGETAGKVFYIAELKSQKKKGS